MRRAPSDQAERDRLVHDLDTTLFVEAGAGTGKTAAVVSRVVALITAGAVKIDRLVAITFTEAAAAELRVRIRQGLEELATDPQRTEVERERCRTAIEGLDAARLETIHAFASALLRTWPLQAGLPPDFQVLSDIDQDVEFRERSRRWLDGLLPGTPGAQAVGRALLLGMQPRQVRAAVRGLEENHDLLTPTTSWPFPPPPDALATAHRLGGRLRVLGEMADLCHNLEDRLLSVVTDAQFAADRLSDAASEDAALAAVQLIERIPYKTHGSMASWADHAVFGNACTHIKGELEAIEQEAGECVTAHRVAALSRLLTVMRDLLLEEVARRRARGVASFHDLLAWARDLLRDHPDVLRQARQRWERIVVDEFQDTDPLQAELAFLLAGDPQAPAAPDWRTTLLIPGKLTLVGDPKQSIYRFRRADIGVYEATKQAVLRGGGDTVILRENFRSVARILGWANHHFPTVMAATSGVQPEYVPLAASHADSGTGVWTMGDVVEGPMREVWGAEAEAVAEAARRVVASGFAIRERADEATVRPARYGDVCILVPTRTNLWRLERALERHQVPYQVASGTLIIATQEVRDLLSCLRAVDDPTDQVALVAALRSPAFGVSDVELLRWRESSGSLDYEVGRRGQGERVNAAFEELKRLRQLRHELSVAALVETIVEEHLLVAAAFEGPRPRDVWRRYRYVAERARAFAATGRSTLGAFVTWMEGLQRDQVSDPGGTALDADEDAVRILTVHGAKGLEFPVVILTGCGARRQFRPPAVIPDRVAGCVELRLGDFATSGYGPLKEHEERMASAESVRLMYVAATRARDHLILSLHRGKTDDCHAAEFVTTLATFPAAAPLPDGPLPEAAEEPEPAPAAEPEPAEHAAAERLWLDRRAALVAAHRAVDVRSATGIAHQPAKDEFPAHEEDVAAYRRGRAATAVGRAVHAVLQVIDLAGLDGLADLVRAQAAAEEVPHHEAEVAQLVRAACASEAVRRAVTAGRYSREVPVGTVVDRVALEGFIDLLYEEADGSLVVVDYKTDRLSPGELAPRLDRYRLQGGVYALLVERTTGRPVTRVEFVFAALGITEPLPDLPGAVAEVRGLLRPATRTGC